MVKLSSFQFRAGIILTVILIIALIGMVNVHSEAGTDKRRSDIVTIDLPALPGGEQMPAVQFFHDLHTETLKGKKDCKACHQQKDNQLVFKFKRLEDSNTDKDMNIYHDNCIDCHKETADVQYKSFLLLADNRSGPVSGDCRSCHNSSSKSGSSRQPVSFDKSLHYRHESAKLIKPIKATDEVNCSACHHKYDKDAKKTIYKKGEEEACGYCHKPQKTSEASSIRSASHDACVNCHQQLADHGRLAHPGQPDQYGVVLLAPAEDLNATVDFGAAPDGGIEFALPRHVRHVAAELFEDDVPYEVKQRRNNELLAVQNEITGWLNARLVGQTTDILVEGPSKAGAKQDVADAAVVDFGVLPGPVAEVAVGRDTDDFHAAALEILELLVEGDDLGRAHEGEVQGIEEQDHVLAPEVGKLKFVVEAVVRHHGRGGEVGSLGRNQGHGHEIEVQVIHESSLLETGCLNGAASVVAP